MSKISEKTSKLLKNINSCYKSSYNDRVKSCCPLYQGRVKRPPNPRPGGAQRCIGAHSFS